MKSSKWKFPTAESLRSFCYSLFKSVWQITHNQFHFFQDFSYRAFIY